MAAPTDRLGPRDKELVALGAALASNCIPCLVYHIAAARKVGLQDGEIRAALALADGVRQSPARQALGAARAQLSDPPSASPDCGDDGPSCCGG